MTITEADVEQFLEALKNSADLRERARAIILADDFLELPKALARLSAEVAAFSAETRARFEEVDKRFQGVDHRFDGVDRRFDGVDRRFDGVDRRFDRVDEDIATLKSDVSTLKSDVSTLKSDVSTLKGDVSMLKGEVGNLVGSSFEDHYRSNLSARLGRRFKRLRQVTLGEEGIFESGLESGVFTPEEWDEAVLLDVVVRATPRQPADANEVLLAIELSRTVDASDVERAARRAQILRKVYENVVAVVDGATIAPAAKARATELDVLALVTREAEAPAA